MALKLGKAPHTTDDRDLKLATYLKTSVLPKPPASFGHEKFVAAGAWRMLGNDQVGDCVFAGAAHETMLWNAEASRTVTFSPRQVIADYSAVTGYVPGDPSTDQGTSVRDAMKYRQKTGIVSDHGTRHTIAAYASVDPHDWATIMTAIYLFGAVGIGIQFPRSAGEQFNAGKGWSLVTGSPIEGGHYVPLVARRRSARLVTWGKLIAATKGFLTAYMDEVWVPLSEEALTAGRSLEGFDDTALRADLKAMTA